MSIRTRLRRPSLILAMGLILVLGAACGSGTGPGAEGSDSTSPSGSAGRVSAPTFSVETFSHGTFDLASLNGKPVVINFWFPSCPPCAAEMPDLQEAYERYGDEVQFVGVQQIGLDTAQDGREFIAEVGVSYPNFADEGSKVQFDYAVLSYPTTVFLDRDHSISRTWMGLIQKNHLDEQIQAIIDS